MAPATGCVVRASEQPPRHRGGDGDCRGGRCAGAADRGCGVPRDTYERRTGRGLAHGRGGTDAGRPRAPLRGVAARHDAVGRRSDVRAERAVDGAGNRRVLRTDGGERCRSGRARPGAVLRRGRPDAVRQRLLGAAWRPRSEAAARSRGGGRSERRGGAGGVRSGARAGQSLRIHSADLRGGGGEPDPPHPARDRRGCIVGDGRQAAGRVGGQPVGLRRPGGADRLLGDRVPALRRRAAGAARAGRRVARGSIHPARHQR